MMELDHGFFVVLFFPFQEKRKEAYHPTNCIQSGMIATPINLLLVSGGDLFGCYSRKREKKLLEMAFIQLYKGKF